MSKVNFIRNYAKKNLLKTTDEGIMIIPNTQKVDFQEGILRQLLIENGINPDAIKSDGAMNEAMAFINQSSAAKTKTIAKDNVIDITDQMPSPFKNIEEAKKKGDLKGIFNQVLRDPDIAREFMLSKKFPFREDLNVRSGDDAIPLARAAKFDEETKNLGISITPGKDAKGTVGEFVDQMKKFGVKDKDIQMMLGSGKSGQVDYVMEQYGLSASDVVDLLKRGKPLIEGMAQGGRIGFKEGNGNGDGMTGIALSIEERMEKIKKLLKQMQDIQKGKGVDPDPEEKAKGGRAGFAQGLGPRFIKFLSENSPVQAFKKYNKSVKDRMKEGKELEVASEVIPIAASGALVTNQLKKMLKNMNEEQKKERQDKMFKEFSQEYKEKYKDSPELLEKMLLDLHENIYMEEKADGGRIGYAEGNGVADEDAQTAKFAKRVRELMDDGFDMGEAVRQAMKEGYRDGGRIGLKDGMDRRTFMKIMGGLATIPILGKFFKTGKTAKVAKDVTKVVPNTQPPDYFFSLAEKIKLLGKESKVKPQERVNEYYYKGKNGDEYTLTEDISTGDMQIVKDKPGIGTVDEKSFDTINDRTVMEYKKGRGDETTRGTPSDEYDEYKVEFDQDGAMAGADDISEIIKKEIVDEVSDNIPSIKKASGGIARMLGE